jgi:hypothetical protein
VSAPTLSTGETSTLGVWLRLSTAMFGPSSPATEFLQQKVAEQGEDEAVVVDERQLLYALTQMHAGGES